MPTIDPALNVERAGDARRDKQSVRGDVRNSENQRWRSGRCPLSGKLSLDSGLIDDRPDGRDLGESELVKDVLRKRNHAAVDAQPEELPLWGASEGEASCEERGRAG